ncbi:hypothetical protein ACTL6P_11070 [Endozoicomonas acroporae]
MMRILISSTQTLSLRKNNTCHGLYSRQNIRNVFF